MLVTDIFRLATRMFRTNRSRTILTILGIGVGIGAILFLVSFGYGLRNLVFDQITTSDALLSLDVNSSGIENLKLDKEVIEEIKKNPGVDMVSPLVTTQTKMSIGDVSTELQVNFVDSDYFRLDGTTVSSGELYDDSQDGHKKKIVISSSALQLFNLSEEEAYGKNIKFTLFSLDEDQGGNSLTRESIELEDNYQIIGIIKEDASNYVYMPFVNSEYLNTDVYNSAKVKVRAETDLDIVRDVIIEKGFMVSALSDIIEQANQIFKVMQIVLASFGIVALAVSAIGMFNTMTIALLERTQEIGIMKALGATAADIWMMFLAESVIIGFLGGATGIMIGFLGGEVFNYGINILAGFMGGEKIDMFYTPLWFAILIITFSTVVGLGTGFYPARRAARINSLEALRYK